MKKGMKLLAAVLMGISAVACSSYEKMVKMAGSRVMWYTVTLTLTER